MSVDTGNGTRDLWTYDLARGLRTRQTVDPGNEYDGVWSPDGSMLAFNSSRKGVMNLYLRHVASGVEETLLEDGLSKFPQSWSPDGKFLLYLSLNPDESQDVFVLPVAGDRKPIPFVVTEFSEGIGARFSPDGRWISYTSDESRRQEIYIKPFPDTGQRWIVSVNGGLVSSWRNDGRELYYIEPPGRLMAASIAYGSDGPRIDAVAPIATIKTLAGPRAFYDAMPDGQRFLVNSLLDEAARTPITLVVNWRSLLGDQ